MKSLANFSSLFKKVLQNPDFQELELLIDEFGDYLVTNINNSELKRLNNKSLLDFEFCCSIIEFQLLHTQGDSDICYTIKKICENHEKLDFLKSRMICLSLPDEINHIKNQWKSYLEEVILKIVLMHNMNSEILSGLGKEEFIKRLGVKIINQFKKQLDQINLIDELPIQISKLIIKHNNDTKQIPFVLKWYTAKKNDNNFEKKLFNI